MHVDMKLFVLILLQPIIGNIQPNVYMNIYTCIILLLCYWPKDITLTGKSLNPLGFHPYSARETPQLPGLSASGIFRAKTFFCRAISPLFVIVSTSTMTCFWEEKLNFNFSFIHILRIMRLSVQKRELNVSEHVKTTSYFFEIFAKNMKYKINVITLYAWYS